MQRRDDYAVTLTYNAIHDLLRRRFPQRTRLKSRLRYVLTRDPRFSLWSTPTDILEALVGELPEIGEADAPAVLRRIDGSWSSSPSPPWHPPRRSAPSSPSAPAPMPPGAELAAIRAITREIPFRGELPISLPGLYPIGYGLSPGR